MTANAIEASGLVKRYGAHHALRGVTFSVPRGSVCGFLGRNGAGKSTTLKLLLGLARPTAGTATVLGEPVGGEAAAVRVRARTGFVSERKELYPYMTGEQLLRFTRGFYPNWRSGEEERLKQRFGVPLHKTACQLSRGNLTKLNLLLALCRGAELLVLDEPTEGLDPAALEVVLEAIVGAAAGGETTVLFSSHQLAEVERIADRVVLIDGGRIVLEEGLEELRASARRVQFVLADAARDAEWARFGPLRRAGRAVAVLTRRGAAELERAVRAAGAEAVESHPVSLREIFLETTTAPPEGSL
jgi:ABC-2 type transport system ATP-binding protein